MFVDTQINRKLLARALRWSLAADAAVALHPTSLHQQRSRSHYFWFFCAFLFRLGVI